MLLEKLFTCTRPLQQDQVRWKYSHIWALYTWLQVVLHVYILKPLHVCQNYYFSNQNYYFLWGWVEGGRCNGEGVGLKCACEGGGVMFCNWKKTNSVMVKCRDWNMVTSLTCCIVLPPIHVLYNILLGNGDLITCSSMVLPSHFILLCCDILTVLLVTSATFTLSGFMSSLILSLNLLFTSPYYHGTRCRHKIERCTK